MRNYGSSEDKKLDTSDRLGNARKSGTDAALWKRFWNPARVVLLTILLMCGRSFGEGETLKVVRIGYQKYGSFNVVKARHTFDDQLAKREIPKSELTEKSVTAWPLIVTPLMPAQYREWNTSNDALWPTTLPSAVPARVTASSVGTPNWNVSVPVNSPNASPVSPVAPNKVPLFRSWGLNLVIDLG